MAIKLYIIRHGQPASQEPGYTGGENPGLSKLGQVQAQRTAEQIAEWGIDTLYSSTYRRAIETALPIHEKLGVPWHMWPALSETGRRSWPRLRERQADGAGGSAYQARQRAMASGEHLESYPLVSELAKRYPAAKPTQPFEWPDDWYAPLIDETREETYARAHLVLGAIKNLHKDGDRVAVVCHGAFGSVLLTVLAEGPPCDHNRYGFAHAAIARVDLMRDGTTMFELVDHIAHLLPDLVTEGPEF